MPLFSDGGIEVKGRETESITHWSLISRQEKHLPGNILSEKVQRHDFNFSECHCQMKVITVSVMRLLTLYNNYKEWRKWYLHCLVDDPGFLQQVLGYLRSDHCSSAGELHLQVLAKAAGVIIDDGAGVSKCFHQAVNKKDLLLECLIIGLNKTLCRISNWEINIVEVIMLLSTNGACISAMCLSIHVISIISVTATVYFIPPLWIKSELKWIFLFNVVTNPDWHQLEPQINWS